MRNGSHDIAHRFVFALALIGGLSNEAVSRPGGERHLDDDLGSKPIHTGQLGG